jgi:hypothetical protein
MPQTSLADYLEGWGKLITNVIVNEAELPAHLQELYAGPLSQVLEAARQLNARLQSRVGVKQQETVERRELMRTGRLLASKLRAALRAHHGFSSERLLEYDIRPIRSRRRSPEQPEDPEQPEGPEDPEPEDPTPIPE